MAKRLAGRVGYSKEKPFGVTMHLERLSEPRQWKKPRRIFVCSMGDLFHELVWDEFIFSVFEQMIKAPQHTYMVLTKRAYRMYEFFTTHPRFDFVQENIWLGVSVEHQAAADERLPWLLQTPAAMRFASCEPLLGPVELGDYKGLDWVIVGGESGPRARPMHPDWARKLMMDCGQANIPFFFKQWGKWWPEDQWTYEFMPEAETAQEQRRYGSLKADGTWSPCDLHPGLGMVMFGVGKKAAGKRLDGSIWDEIPCRCETTGCESRFARHYKDVGQTFEGPVTIEGNWCDPCALRHGFCPGCGSLYGAQELMENCLCEGCQDELEGEMEGYDDEEEEDEVEM
jgi:protein gp37